MDIELITLVNSFRNTITLNNLLVKEKIIRKLEMIHTMQWYGFPLMNFPQSKSNKIMQELRRIDNEGDIVKYSHATNNSDTNKLLGNILHNAYQASGYNVILYNVPIYGTTIKGNFIQLDSEAIYDTLTQYAPMDEVKSVCQIAADTYLIKMDTNENGIELCHLLNEKLLEGRIIKIEYIAPLTNQIDLIKNNAQSIIRSDIENIYQDNPSNPSNPINPINSSNPIILDNILQNYLSWFLDIIVGFIQNIKNIMRK